MSTEQTARYTHPTTRRRVLRPGDVVKRKGFADWGQGIVQMQCVNGWAVLFPGRPAHYVYQRTDLELVERDGAKLSDRVEPA